LERDPVAAPERTLADFAELRCNSISTFGDIYGHDARMAAALFSNDVAFDPRANEERQGTQVRRSGAMGNAIAESLSGFLDN
jgi:hypothetical protein